ncbi:hypothetical protein CR513_46041, partial [Mucuna pruriens]
MLNTRHGTPPPISKHQSLKNTREEPTLEHEDKILVHCFQDSLTGVALSWYVSLERGRIRTWRDLVEAFLRHYKYNIDMAPDHSWLQNLLKNEQEGFKEYAQRWH